MREAASFISRQTVSEPAGIVQSLLQWGERALRAWMRRRMVSRLIDMDDHLLADIGVARHDVRRALHEPFGTDPSIELQRIVDRRQGWRR